MNPVNDGDRFGPLEAESRSGLVLAVISAAVTLAGLAWWLS